MSADLEKSGLHLIWKNRKYVTIVVAVSVSKGKIVAVADGRI